MVMNLALSIIHTVYKDPFKELPVLQLHVGFILYLCISILTTKCMHYYCNRKMYLRFLKNRLISTFIMNKLVTC